MSGEDAGRQGPTPAQTVGPFFHFGLTTNERLGQLAGPEAKGERIRLHFRLFDGDGEAVPDGIIELWQADATGRYDHPADTQARTPDPALCGFGRLATNATGTCTFETVRPGGTPDGCGNYQAAHINITVFARGLLDRLCTRVYFDGDSALGEDPVLKLVPHERRQTLIAKRSEDTKDWQFDIHLQGEKETVFFAI